MHFNTALTGLGDEATLAFKNTTLSLSEFRYAIDVSMSSSIPNELVNLLEVQGIYVDVGTDDGNGEWSPKRNHAWFQQGVTCEVTQPDNPTPRKGKLKLRLQLEFCPDVADRGTANMVTQPVEVSPKVGVMQPAEVPQQVRVAQFR